MLIGQQIGPFEIEKELGSGAMGTVYRAKFHRSADVVMPVALKFVALGLLGNDGARARFDREANILKQLKHPHIVRMIAHGKIKRDTPYIAMEYIDGESLDHILARRGKLGWEEVLTYGRHLCDALQYAHDKGIIHRDLKPSNLMIAKDGTLKLTDFGIAKDADMTALTGANSTIGTAAYMSPEQCKGDRNLSNKSDLYSLGVVFFELLTGRKPFTAETTVEMFLKHVNEKAPRIGKQVNELPTKFESLILQLLEKDKDNRPVDAAWVGRMLAEVEEDAYTRKSAGLAVAEARTAKPTNQSGDRMDADDKAAARALRGKKKKAKKKVHVPFYQRKWVQAAGILAVFAAMAVAVWQAVKPASAESMYAAVERADTPAEKAAAAAKFLDAHGKGGGELVDKAAAVFRDATVRERERQLANRYESRNLRKPFDGDDPGAFEFAMQAMDAERGGDLTTAETMWGKVKGRFPQESQLKYTTKDDELAKARWGWLAEKHIGDIKAARDELVKVQNKIKDSREYELAAKPDAANPEWLATKAIRLKEMTDHARAAETATALVKLAEADPDKRAWRLLGTYLLSIPPKGPDDPQLARARRADLLKAWLDETERKAAMVRNDPAHPSRAVWARDARNRARDVTELYADDDTDAVRAAVDRAGKIAATVPKP